MSDTPNNPSTPESSANTPAETAHTEPVAVTEPVVAPTTPTVGPPAAPTATAPTPDAPPARRTWLRNGLIAAAALVLAGLIFSAGAAVGFVGGRRFDRRDEMGDRFEEVFGESNRQRRRATIEECFFDNNSQNRDESCPPFMRDEDTRFDDGGRDDNGEVIPVPVPPIGRGGVGSSSDQPVIVYPDGRVIPLEPNTTAPEATPVVPETTTPAGP